MGRIVLLFISVLVVVLLIITLGHAKQYFKEPENIDILQIDLAKASTINTYLKQNLPIVVRNITHKPQINLHYVVQEKDISHADPNLSLAKTKTSVKPTVSDILQGKRKGHMVYRNQGLGNIVSSDFRSYLNLLQSSLSVCISYYLYVLPSDSVVLPRRYQQARNWLFVERGECLVQLFHPKHAKFLRRALTDQLDCELYKLPPTTQKIQPKYTEVILRAGQSILIPQMWVYGFRTVEPTIIVNCSSDDPFTYVFKGLGRILKNKNSV